MQKAEKEVERKPTDKWDASDGGWVWEAHLWACLLLQWFSRTCDNIWVIETTEKDSIWAQAAWSQIAEKLRLKTKVASLLNQHKEIIVMVCTFGNMKIW